MVLLFNVRLDILVPILTLWFRIFLIFLELKKIMQKKMTPWDEFTTRKKITRISIPIELCS